MAAMKPKDVCDSVVVGVGAGGGWEMVSNAFVLDWKMTKPVVFGWKLDRSMFFSGRAAKYE